MESLHARSRATRPVPPGRLALPVAIVYAAFAATLVLIHDYSARARIERRLAASEARLRPALDATGLGLWDYAEERDTVEGNEKVARMRRRAPEVFSESRAAWAGRVHPDDGAAVCERRELGLTGMRERVSLAGGTVAVASSADAGSRVRAILPLAPEAPA